MKKTGNRKRQVNRGPKTASSKSPFGVSREKKDDKPLRLAKIAIENYNDQKGTAFEVLKVVGFDSAWSDKILKYGIYYHLNFQAMPRDEITNGHIIASSDVSRTLFFAEILRVRFEPSRGYHVDLCHAFEPDDPGFTVGCRICSSESNVRHPANGFSSGDFPYVPPMDSSSQQLFDEITNAPVYM